MSERGGSRLLAIPLGDTQATAAPAVVRAFHSSTVDWFDRSALRRRPAAGLWSLLARRYDDAVLIAPDLGHPRLHLTAALLVVPRAGRRWLMDPRGERRSFSRASYLRGSGAAALRHLAGCVLATALAQPALRLGLGWLALERRLGLRRLPARAPRRVLYLRSQLWFGLRGGGSVAHVAGVVGGLQQEGVEVHVLSTDRLEGVEATTTVVPTARWFDGRLKEAEELSFNRPFSAAALRARRSFRPDLVYQRYEAFNFTGALVSRLSKVHLVLEFNSSEVWKAKHWGGLRMLGLARLGERLNLAAADLIVVVSDVLRDSLVEAGIPPSKVLVNPNGVDPERFCPGLDVGELRSELGFERKTVLGFSGTFGLWHGIPTLAAAMPLVARARPDAAFLLLGDGPLRKTVEDTVARHGLEDRVVLPGLVPHAQMPRYLAACDVLLSPHGRQADGHEFFGSPTKLYEYMAAGRAIVASRVGQIGDVLSDEETALLVEPDDPDALVEAIVRLVDDPSLRDRLGRAARAQAERSHTWRRNAERLLGALSDPGREARHHGG